MNPKKDYVRKLRDEHPDWTIGQIAHEAGCSERSVFRYLGPHKHIEHETPEDQIQYIDPADVRILFLDVETNLMEVFVWGLGQQYVGPDQVVKDFSLSVWSAKWYMDPRVYSARVTTEEAKNREDGSIMQRLWNLLDKAHYVVAHNAAKFDVRKINARFLLNGLPKPSPFIVIDTLKITRKNFALSSHKLDFIQELLGQTRKTSTGYQLWKDVANGSETALRKMERYCRNDVLLVEELFTVLRPWVSGINVSLFCDASDSSMCPVCGNTNLTETGEYATAVNVYKAFRCSNCKAVVRAANSTLTAEQRKVQLRTI